ncbi:guanylate kinase [Sphingomonas daechungensis]|uniref:guanylate kinase n=1 Tax=Sphingomonas daechungensis TaxID=1176646 RepID=UPI001CB8A57B|nr:guanylate kinase [Sphingomonas daechungensis]
MDLDDADPSTRAAVAFWWCCPPLRRGQIDDLPNASRCGSQITMSISATTRPRRSGEVDDVDYHFVAPRGSRNWSIRTSWRSGLRVRSPIRVPKEPIKEALRLGRDILFDIDWQGTQQLRGAFGTDLVRIFILPPSMAELERRLRARNTDSDEVIESRMKRAASEIGHWGEYDYVLINEDMDHCLHDVQAIIAANV